MPVLFVHNHFCLLVGVCQLYRVLLNLVSKKKLSTFHKMKYKSQTVVFFWNR